MQIHRDIYTGQRETYKQQIQYVKAKFYTTKNDECARNNKALLRITDDLIKRKAAPKLPTPVTGVAHLADDFLEHFTLKVLDIHSQLVGRRLQTVNAEYVHYEMSCTVSAFSDITTDGVLSLVRKCPTKSSALDPLPTSLVEANIDILAPTLATIINMSLKSGSVPANFKHAVITPLLKKRNLDPDSMNNHLLISNLSFVSKLLEVHTSNITVLRQRWCAFRLTI